MDYFYYFCKHENYGLDRNGDFKRAVDMARLGCAIR